MENYVMTDVGLIPQSWKIEKLGDLGFFKNGINKDKDDFGFGYPMVNLNHVFSNFSINNSMSFDLVNANENERKNYALKKGDILFIRSSVKPEGVGLTSVVDYDLVDTTYSGFIIRFRLHKDYLVHKFKHYVFYENRFRHRLICKSSVSANTNINQGALNSLKIPIPPKEEQKAIANCLSTWDEAIEKQTKLIAAKEQRKKALMQQLLSGKKRLPGFTEDWKEVSLGKLFSERVETKREDLELLSVGQQGVYPQTESNKRDISNADKSKYKRIVPGDIGYNTMRMWQGRSALSGLEGIVSPAYTILIPRDKVDSYFFSCLFKTKKLMHLFWRNSQGLVGDTLNCKYKDFSIIKISIPSFEEQQKISTMLKNQDNEIILMKKKLDFLLGQKKGIMQKLLTGKVRLIP